MWLVYLRFDSSAGGKAHHVPAANREEAEELVTLAFEHGLPPAAPLAEYALFYSRGVIHPKHTPNFHYYKRAEFIEKLKGGR